MMIDESVKLKFLGVKPDNELTLLEEFLLELTFAIRSICLDNEITKDEQLIGLKQINEINHDVLNVIWKIRNGESWSNKEETWNIICNHVRLAPYIAGWVGTAVIRSLQTVHA